MKELKFADLDNTYLISLPGIYLVSDLRHELTAEVIADGINAYLGKLNKAYAEGSEGTELEDKIQGLNTFGENTYLDDPVDLEKVEYVFKDIACFLNEDYLQEYYDPVIDSNNILLEHLLVKKYTSLMMEGFEKDWINFYYLSVDPENLNILVHEIDKETDILGIKDIYREKYVDFNSKLC